MGDAFIRLQRYRDAIEVLERVHELAKPEDVIYEAIGYCYEKLKQPAIARLQYRKASHLRKDDSRLIYKIACTYFAEAQWGAAYKQIEVALRIIRGDFDYQLLAGQCCEQLERIQEAVEHYVMAVQLKPKKMAGWDALICCLFEAEAWDDALKQIDLALHATKGKALFLYYRAAVLFGATRNQEALKQLEEALMKDPKQVKKFVSLIPSVMQQVQVVDLLARYKRKRGE